MQKKYGYITILNFAITIATEAHIGQTDKAGKPYILHPLRVMGKLTDIKDQIVAVLHDVIEDCPGYSVNQFRDVIGDELADALDAITKVKGEEYAAYLERVAANPIAKKVKIEDLIDNMRAIPDPTPEDEARIRKYANALEFLAAT